MEENEHEATVIQIDASGSIPMMTVRDAAGREIAVPHYDLCAGYEDRSKGDWIAESDPRALDWLEREIRRGFERSECGAIDRDNESRIARNREILRRNGRAVTAWG